MVLLQDLAETCFAARIEIRSVEIIHARFDGTHHFTLGLFEVYIRTFPRKAHAAVPQL